MNSVELRKHLLKMMQDAFMDGTINENLKNRKGRNSNNKSGYRNVSWDGYKWIVQLQVNGKNTCLGRFPENELEQAGKFAEEMRQKYYGKFAGSN